MKSNKKKILILIVLGIVFAISTISNQNFSDDKENSSDSVESREKTILKRPKKSAIYPETFIHINNNIPDNWSDTESTYGWCSGDGSWGNPYIIENVTINAGSSGDGVLIQNSKNVYFIIRNCNVTNAGSGTWNAGIKLVNTCNGTLINNKCSNNGRIGILLDSNCVNNTISGNTANDNSNAGIVLGSNCDNNTISGNTANDNSNAGINLHHNCDNNTISGNIACFNMYYGILLYANCDDNTVSRNNADDNIWIGIWLYEYCDNNIISGNNASRMPLDFGIHLATDCDNNTISGNTANYNGWQGGIFLSGGCDNNTISGNTANENDDYGIYLEINCDDNFISGNNASNIMTSNQDKGIFLYDGCDNNIISGNTANENIDYGIYLETNCDDNIISGNNASNIMTSNQDRGIYLYVGCDNNTISGNTANDNIDYGLYLDNNCDDNNLTENYVYFNTNGAININSANCNDSIIKRNVMVSNNAKFINDVGINTIFFPNYFGITPPSFFIEVIEHSFSTTEFVVTIDISSQFIELEVSTLSIQIWWSGIAVPSSNIIDLGSGQYNISLTPIFVEPGEDPILLNMTISEIHHLDKYFELNLAVDPKAVTSPPPPRGGDGDDDDGAGPEGESLIPLITVVGASIAVGCVAVIIAWKKELFTKLKRK